MSEKTARLERTILVIEDEKPLARAISKKLDFSGFDVVTARSVEQALGYLEDIDKIDAVWLDHYLLGEMDGLDFLERVKSHQDWKGLPVFVVTNTAGADKRLVYLKLGATEYFIKSENRLDKIISSIKKDLFGDAL